MRDDLDALESSMRQQRLVAYPSTDESDRLPLPRMVDIYVKCCRDLSPEYVCTQDRFLNAVVAACPDLPSDGVRARASRTYPALVRQQHFLTALRTRTSLEGVHWIPDMDYRGIDLLVLDHGCVLGVALSLNTANAAHWQTVKAQRHPPLAGLAMLRLDLDPDNAPRVGPFWVHPLADVWRVQDAMTNLMQKRLPSEGEWRTLFQELKTSGKLRPKAGFADATSLLKVVYERIASPWSHVAMALVVVIITYAVGTWWAGR